MEDIVSGTVNDVPTGDMAQGTYSVEVRTTYATSGKPSKTLKTGRFGKDLTV